MGDIGLWYKVTGWLVVALTMILGYAIGVSYLAKWLDSMFSPLGVAAILVPTLLLTAPGTLWAAFRAIEKMIYLDDY